MKPFQGNINKKRKSRADINEESWARKRQKKRRGNMAGARNRHGADATQKTASTNLNDPRIGSKKPVPLIIEPHHSANRKPTKTQTPEIPLEQQLAALENDARLNQLLDALDNGQTLSAEEKRYVDETLDRIDALMEKLGIDLDDDDAPADEAEQKEDLVKLLKTNR